MVVEPGRTRGERFWRALVQIVLGFAWKASHALVAGSGARASAYMLRNVRQLEAVVEEGPMDAYQSNLSRKALPFLVCQQT